MNTKELAINQRCQYFLIEEGHENAREIAEEFEPRIMLDEAIKRGPADAICTSWLRTVDEVRNYLMNRTAQLSIVASLSVA